MFRAKKFASIQSYIVIVDSKHACTADLIGFPSSLFICHRLVLGAIAVCLSKPDEAPVTNDDDVVDGDDGDANTNGNSHGRNIEATKLTCSTREKCVYLLNPDAAERKCRKNAEFFVLFDALKINAC